MPLFRRAQVLSCLTVLLIVTASLPVFAQGGETAQHSGEVNLVVPPLTGATFFNGISGPTLLKGGLVVALLGMVFGLVIYQKLRNLPVHSSMLEISELIYETCKTYLQTQGRFLIILEIFIGSAMTHAPRDGTALRLAMFSRPGTPARAAI